MMMTEEDIQMMDKLEDKFDKYYLFKIEYLDVESKLKEKAERFKKYQNNYNKLLEKNKMVEQDIQNMHQIREAPNYFALDLIEDEEDLDLKATRYLYLKNNFNLTYNDIKVMADRRF